MSPWLVSPFFPESPCRGRCRGGFLFWASAPARRRRKSPAAKPEMMENCPGLIASERPRVMPASFRTALNEDQVRITYSGHSTFLIESPQFVRIATDYNDYVRPPVLPDIVTMNHAHDAHYTDRPDPRIKHVLRGWGPSPGQPARHDIRSRTCACAMCRPTSAIGAAALS